MTNQIIEDPHFRVEVIAATPNPQQTIWMAMHQCYSEGSVWDCNLPSEENCGKYIEKHLLNVGHFSPLEMGSLVFNIVGFPHSVMQQLTRSRVGVSFSVQSSRYTGQRIVDVTEGKRTIDQVFYFRPVGTYTDREGKHYDYTELHRRSDIDLCGVSCIRYANRLSQGFSEEHARGLLPFDFRQNLVMGCNVRSLMALFDRRSPADAQLEIQTLVAMMLPHFEQFTPSIAEWYKTKRWGKNKLAP